MMNMQEWLDAYGESHQNPTNKSIHWICIPFIYFSIVGLITSIPNGLLVSILPDAFGSWANWTILVILIVMIFYIRLSIPMFLGMLLWSLFCFWANLALSNVLPISLALFSIIIFVLAWIGQFIGHNIEGKKPSFFDDLKFLLVGPAWLMAFIFNKLGIKY